MKYLITEMALSQPIYYHTLTMVQWNELPERPHGLNDFMARWDAEMSLPVLQCYYAEYCPLCFYRRPQKCPNTRESSIISYCS